MNKKYILFDLDGTISNPAEGITNSIKYALKHFGITVQSEEVLGFIGPPLRDSFKRYLGFDDEQTELATTKFREYFADKGAFENVLYDGMADLLKTLHESGKKLILASSKVINYSERILEYFGVLKYFDFISGCEMDGFRSEKTEVIEYAVEKNMITSKDAVMIGDRHFDIIGAKNHGIESIGVTYGFGSEQELSDAGANLIVNSVNELKNLLI